MKRTSGTNANNTLIYKGYYGIPQFSVRDKCFYGKLHGIRDCIMFEGQSVKELEKAFRDSVDEYLDQCAREGIEPQKSFSGKFNLRIPPDLHAQAAQTAERQGKSVNQLIVEAIKMAVEV